MNGTIGSRAAAAVVIAALVAWCSIALAAGPTLGSAAPNFRLQDQDGEWHTLDQYRGKWVALYFYPKDQTPGCTTQACDFRDNIFAFRESGAVILGISVDDVASHREFAEKHGLPFRILADSTRKTATDYGVLTRLFGIMEVAKRETFLINPQGRVAKHYFDVKPEGHSTVVITDIRALMAKQKAG
jgi:thioredoxin-dependent peroxiredoxin